MAVYKRRKDVQITFLAMISSTVIIVLVNLCQLAVSQQRICVSCASPGLRGRWQITGLPPVSNDFYQLCTGATLASMNTETCSSGPCITMVFQDPDTTDTADNNLLYIRGCQQTIMQVKSSLTSNQNETCEDDLTYPFTDSNGLPARRRLSVFYCNTNVCNAISNMPANFCGERIPANQLPAKGIIDCYECTGKGCKDKTCKGKKYCLKQSLTIGSVKEVQKTCSNVNIYGTGNICQQNEVITTPGGIAVKTKYEQCICESDHCNHSSKTMSIATIGAIIVMKLML